MRGGILLLIAFLFSSIAAAHDKPVAMQLRVDDSATHFILNVKIKDGWKVYGPYWSKEGKPFSIGTDGSDNVSAIYISWPEQKRDALLPDVDLYSGELDIPISVDANLKEAVKLRLNVNAVACKDICVQINEVVQAEAEIKSEHDYTQLIISVALAFIGGVILNFMPCVLPVIGLKIYHIAKYSSGTRRDACIHGLYTSLGVLTVFIGLAFMVIFMRSIGDSMGWGMHFQQPIFIIFAIIAVFISAMMMNGDISFTMRGFNFIEDKSGYIASFFSGILSAVLSTPCTAPFITSAVAFALTQKPIVIILIYCAMGMGMALPLLLISVNAKVARFLPSPGAWMERLKKFFAVVMLLSMLWLLYVLSDQLGGKSAILIGGGLILLKFSLIQISGWKRWIAIGLIASFMMIIPNEVARKDAINAQWADMYWEPFSISKLEGYKKQGALVMVDVTAQWCVVCKVNKFLVLENMAVLEFLKMHDVKMLRADLTSFSSEIDMYMKQEDRNGIPYNVIYGPKNMRKIIFPEILTAKMIQKAVHELEK